MSEQGTKEVFKKKDLSEMSKDDLISYRNSLAKDANEPGITSETQDFIMKEVMAVDEELGLRDASKISL